MIDYEGYISDLIKGKFRVEQNQHKYTKPIVQNIANTYDRLVYNITPKIQAPLQNFNMTHYVNIWEETPQPYENYIVCTADKNGKFIGFIIQTTANSYFAAPLITRLGKITLIDMLFVMDTYRPFGTFVTFKANRHNAKVQQIQDVLLDCMKLNYMVTKRIEVTSTPQQGNSPKRKTSSKKKTKKYIKLYRTTVNRVVTKGSGRGGVGVPKSPHRRRGHWRHTKVGVDVWIKPVDVNNPTGETYYLR